MLGSLVPLSVVPPFPWITREEILMSFRFLITIPEWLPASMIFTRAESSGGVVYQLIEDPNAK